MRVITKGKIALAAATTAAALVLTGCGGGAGSSSTGNSSATSGEVNLIAYSGVWQDQYTAAVIEPFKAKYPDIKINYASKRSSAEMLSALQGQKNNPATDVAIMDNSVSTTGTPRDSSTRLTPPPFRTWRTCRISSKTRMGSGR